VVIGAVGLIENAVQFLRALVLARILSPADFGLMGMALIAMQAGESLSQTGFNRALVQKKVGAEGYLDTVWVICALRGAALALLLFLFAPPIGVFFKTPEAVPIIRSLSLVFFLNGLVNPALNILERDLHFVRCSVPRVAAIVADLAVSVSLALVFRNVWAMVWGYLSGRLVEIATSYLVRPYWPAMRLRREKVKELYQFGRHITRATAAEYFMQQTDKACIGHLLGAESLGLYSFAWRLASLPAAAVGHVVSSVAFPVFSRVQDDITRLQAGYLRALGIMTALTIPASMGLASVASDLVSVAFGAKWMAMIPSFHVLCLFGAFVALFHAIAAIVAGVGRPEIGARGFYLFLGLLAIPIYPAIKMGGILGAAWCMASAAIIAFLALLVAGTKVVGGSLASVARVMAGPIGASLVMAAVLHVVRGLLPSGPSWGSLTFEVVLGAGVYVGVAASLDHVFDAGVMSSLRSAFKTARSPRAGTIQ